MRPDAPKPSIPLGEDIMQLARIGEIGAMQNLFTTKKLTANHRDDEGITPLHVGFSLSFHISQALLTQNMRDGSGMLF